MDHGTYRRHDDLLIPVGNEVVAATRFEPMDSEPEHPVVLTYDPYHKDDFTSFVNRYTDIVYLTAHGYEVVVADMVGSGASTGGAKAMFAPDEGVEAAAIVEWIRDRSWSTGRIGMFGKSYSGITCLKAAAERPDGLEAIIPEFAPTTYGGIYDGGAVFLYWLMSWVAWMQTWQAMPPTRRDEDGRWAGIWHNRLDDLRDSPPWLFEGLEHEAKDHFWRPRDIRVEAIEVPTLAFAGWRDPYHRDTIEYIRQIGAPTRLVLGPWRHERPHLGREIAIDERRQIVEWFDRFLKHEEPRGRVGPSIEYWTEQWDGGRLRSGVWQRTDRWPDINRDQVTHRSFALGRDGLIDLADADFDPLERSYEFDHTVGLASTDTHTPNARELVEPVDTSGDDARSLCFDTQPLVDPYEFTGSGRAVIRLSATTEDPTVVVRVVDVGPTGSARFVSSGRLRLQFRKGYEERTDVTPGREYQVTVPLTPKSYLFEPGHRIRIAISASLFPLLLPTGQHGSLTLYSTPEVPSRIDLPGPQRVEPSGGNDAFEMQPPDERFPLQSPFVRRSSASLRTKREHLSGKGGFEVRTEETFTTPFLEELTRTQRFETSVLADRPESVSSRHRSTADIEFENETIRVETDARAGRDTASMTTTVTSDDAPVFDETWTWARDGRPREATD